MTNIEEQLQSLKMKFTTEVAAALAGDDSAWHRAEIASRDVQRLLSEIKSRPAPVGPWAIAADVFKGQR